MDVGRLIINTCLKFSNHSNYLSRLTLSYLFIFSTYLHTSDSDVQYLFMSAVFNVLVCNFGHAFVFVRLLGGLNLVCL